MDYFEAIVIGLLQGVTELFPISSLGHSILVPAIVGGSWQRDLSVSTPESPYLAFVVGLHVATAFALLLYFWRDWVRIIRGFWTSIRYRRIRSSNERLAWLIIFATIPVGIAGLLLEHFFRTVLGNPIPAAIFLIINGGVLAAGEYLRRRSGRAQAPYARVSASGAVTGMDAEGQQGASGPLLARVAHDVSHGYTWQDARRRSLAEQVEHASAAREGAAGDEGDDELADENLGRMSIGKGIAIGATQILALLPGISRSGVTMIGGMAAGLSHRDAARFAFLLATPVILAAGVLKLPDLFGPLGAHIHGQILAGSVAAFVAALVAVGFLDRYFRTRTLIPFAIYCVVAGALALIWLLVRG